MDRLWEERQGYLTLNCNRHHIDRTCGRYLDFIPYNRRYRNLDEEQLHSLIHDAKLHSWQALDLANCGLTSLPDELWELTELKMLYLGEAPYYLSRHEIDVGEKNNILNLSDKIENLKNLQVLSIRGQHILFENDNTLRLPRLRHLELFGCEFPQVPNAFLIPTIEEIAVDCMAEYLSDSFIKLKNLKRVYFSGSKFTTLPECFGELDNLERLYLFGTEIRTIPNSLINLRRLSDIGINDTPLADKLPPEILKQSAKEIVRYILSQQSSDFKQYFNEAKMVIVGQGHVGKSSVLNRLINDEYTEKESTEGIDISSWHFSMHGQTYKLNVWDFGGQEIYHATHQFFLTKRSLYIFVWDALAEDEYGRIDYWLKTIQSFADDSPIIVVVNKCDSGIGRIRRIDEADLKERFPQINKFFYVSCRDNIGITNLRNTVKSLAVRLPLMKTSWLSSWMSVRKELENLSRTRYFITYNDYLNICKSEDIGYDEARSLIKYLHDLGIVLYYYDDPLLKNLVILSSEWGTDAVYKVLDEQERQLKGRNGILHSDDLPLIWEDSERYPQERYPYLLSLMKKFQLAFEIGNSSYLVTELLDNKVISLERDFSQTETLSFRYEYDFLPAGVMTRFIVAINHYLETIGGVKQCWKKGAYLTYHTAYALVRLYDNLADRYVEIKVSGKIPRDRQELLTIIRTKFEELHGQFSQIVITERIPCSCSADCKFMFDYKKLLQAERKGKTTIECHDTFEAVDIRKLLDGVEVHMENDFWKPNYTTIISPQFTNQSNPSATATAESISKNTVTITVEIRDLINCLHGDLNDLKDEVGNQCDDFNQQCEKVSKALNQLDQSNTKEDIEKSGALNKIERFLTECHNPQSQIGKMLTGVKYAADIVKKLAGGYNKIAKWLALPQLPFGDGN